MLRNHPDKPQFAITVSLAKISVRSLAFCALLLSCPMASAGSEAKMYFAHSDHLGTPKKLTDARGTIVWSADYQPFGQVSLQAMTPSHELRFPGQYFDAETQFNYNYFRYYDFSTSRYTASDPIGLVGGPNTYLYTYANPLRFSDPTGELVHIVIGFVVGGVAGAVAGLQDPCAAPEDIILSALAGALVGSAAAAVPIAPLGLSSAMIRGGLVGLTGNSAGQITTKGFGDYSPTQAITQGAIGMVSGGIGNMGGLRFALSAVRKGLSSAKAIKTSAGVATTEAIGLAVGTNAIVPHELGGLGGARIETNCDCSRDY